jgi:phytanoyl-CoA hydroxylase
VLSISIFFSNRFREICEGKVKDPNIVIMKDVAIHKLESAVGEQAVTKVQDFTSDEELFKYCCLPEIIQHVENFTGPNIIAMNAMV